MKNRVMMQVFEWFLPMDSQHYHRLMGCLDELKEVGIDDLWIPPVTKATGTNDVGYGVYDLYDLGEFDHRGTIPTKYGTKEELHQMIEKAHSLGMKVYADTVLNHRASADYSEVFKAVKVNPENRDETIGEVHDIEGWTGFNFPGRQGKYSEFTLNFNHFTGVDYDSKAQESGIYRIIGDGKYWSTNVSDELGNYDYLMFADVDLEHPEVQEDLFHWVEWFVNETKVDGLRLDALKHIDFDFMRAFTGHCKEKFGDSFYMVGEYWDPSIDAKLEYLDVIDYNIDLFDVKLHFNFHQASLENEHYDLRTIFDGTLIKDHPTLSVTFVDNHDSQLGQSLDSWVHGWFKPHAYTLILMREEGYPCVFWGDYYGIEESDFPPQKEWLAKIIKARTKYAYGDQDDYFEDPNIIGWVRHGDEEHPHKAASLINNAPDDSMLRMFIGEDKIGVTFYNLLADVGLVTIDEEGYGEFLCPARQAAIWVETNAD